MSKYYTADHEWIDTTVAEVARVGITVHAQDALGDVVFVELPEIGRTYTQGEVAGVVESVKAAADVYMPISGTVVTVNEELRADPGLANSDPLGQGWFFEIKLSQPEQLAGLMDSTGYDKLLKNGA
jgi:glycine cleavage system H protein